MGRSKLKELDTKSYALDLNEANVQTIFNRCLTTDDTKQRSRAKLFYTRDGYTKKDSIEIFFDKDVLIKNKKYIEYLYGQLDSVHTGKYITNAQSINDLNKTYNQENWSQNNGIFLELLYLASNADVAIIAPFNKFNGDTTTINPNIKPTISPKDPNFPLWWAEHKSEWSEPKKEGQE
jgi:hypothetical protein